VAFADHTTGVAMSRDNVFMRTTDGGATWAMEWLGLAWPAWVTDVSFANASTGFAVGSDGLVMRTDDAGLSWERVPGAPSLWYDAVAAHGPWSCTIAGGWAVLQLVPDG